MPRFLLSSANADPIWKSSPPTCHTDQTKPLPRLTMAHSRAVMNAFSLDLIESKRNLQLSH